MAYSCSLFLQINPIVDLSRRTKGTLQPVYCSIQSVNENLLTRPNAVSLHIYAGVYAPSIIKHVFN